MLAPIAPRVSMQSSPQRYGSVAIFFHWTVAAFVLVSVAIAWSIETIDDGDPKGLALALHKSTGVVIFVLACARSTWRLTHRAPAYPHDMSSFQRWGATAVHLLLYFTTLTMPITGYIFVAARGRETTLFGLYALPQWVPLDRSLSRLAEAVHDYSQYALYALVAAHVGAALYHHVVVRDEILLRMAPQRWQKYLNRARPPTLPHQ